MRSSLIMVAVATLIACLEAIQTNAHVNASVHAKQSSAAHRQSFNSTQRDSVEVIKSSVVRVELTYGFTTEEDGNSQITFTSTGTGFVLTDHGLVATADHVVNFAKAELDSQNLLRQKGLHVRPSSFHRISMKVYFPYPSTEVMQPRIHGEVYGDDVVTDAETAKEG